MNKIGHTLLSFCLVLPAAALAAPPPFAAAHGALTDGHGMTVYTFDKDKAGSDQSACYQDCAKLWPPVAADADAQASGPYGIINRTDGVKRQWTYQGKPLYLFVKDAKPGEQKGDNLKGIWHVIAQ